MRHYQGRDGELRRPFFVLGVSGRNPTRGMRAGMSRTGKCPYREDLLERPQSAAIPLEA